MRVTQGVPPLTICCHCLGPDPQGNEGSGLSYLRECISIYPASENRAPLGQRASQPRVKQEQGQGTCSWGMRQLGGSKDRAPAGKAVKLSYQSELFHHHQM